MKNKTLIQINGIVGIVGGIFLILSIAFVASSSFNDITRSFSTGRYSSSSTSTMLFLFFILKIIILGLGIYGLIYYKNDYRVSSAPNVLLIIGGGIALIPYLGWIGGIISIVGGGIALSKLKYFSTQNFNRQNLNNQYLNNQNFNNQNFNNQNFNRQNLNNQYLNNQNLNNQNFNNQNFNNHQ